MYSALLWWCHKNNFFELHRFVLPDMMSSIFQIFIAHWLLICNFKHINNILYAKKCYETITVTNYVDFSKCNYKNKNIMAIYLNETWKSSWAQSHKDIIKKTVIKKPPTHMYVLVCVGSQEGVALGSMYAMQIINVTLNYITYAIYMLLHWTFKRNFLENSL